MKTKKAYLFLSDVVVAIIIIGIALAVLYYRYQPRNEAVFYADKLSEDVIGVMAYTKISDLCIKPGLSKSSGCKCPRYTNVTQIVCNDPTYENSNATLLAMMSESIERGSVSGKVIEDTIHEIFVKNNVIDEKRFGFSVIYTNPANYESLEIYNSETYS
ncbi:MAG TPA: hypothetical protein VI564_02440 [Candidatus Nanoarchaeia archaeon]|nr:hypothetical protein [Candidatus Nanoarchaeia archaeon]